MSEHEVRMIILSTDNLDESVRFYSETLGMPLKFRDGAHFAALDGGPVTLALATAVAHPIPGQVVVGVKTADVDAAAKAIEASGGAIVKAPRQQGQRLGLLQSAPPVKDATAAQAPLSRSRLLAIQFYSGRFESVDRLMRPRPAPCPTGAAAARRRGKQTAVRIRYVAPDITYPGWRSCAPPGGPSPGHLALENRVGHAVGSSGGSPKFRRPAAAGSQIRHAVVAPPTAPTYRHPLA